MTVLLWRHIDKCAAFVLPFTLNICAFYLKGSGDMASLSKNYTVDSRHLVLLKGFQLQGNFCFGCYIYFLMHIRKHSENASWYHLAWDVLKMMIWEINCSIMHWRLLNDLKVIKKQVNMHSLCKLFLLVCWTESVTEEFVQEDILH